jgi:hypothetical protein
MTWITPFDCITFLMVILAASPLASQIQMAPSIISTVRRRKGVSLICAHPLQHNFAVAN